MKIIKRYNIPIAAVLLVFALMTSCERTELCYDHFPTLTLGLSWEQEWERDYGMKHADNWDSGRHGFGYDDMRPERSEWVNMVIKKSDGSTTEKYVDPDGGLLNADLGGGKTYLFYNGDTEYILFSDMASPVDARASATLRSRAGLAYITEQHPGVRSTNSPDVLYASYVDNVPTFGIHEHHSLDINMQPLVYTYIIRYEFDYGLEHVSLARGALGGMADSVYLHDGKTSETSSIILYDCDVKPYGCEAHVRSFGAPGFPDEYYGRTSSELPERKYSLNLELLLRNGKSVEFNYDISDQLQNQPRGGVITISGIRIEDQIGDSDSGFDIDVTEWPEHDVIDLPIEVEP